MSEISIPDEVIMNKIYNIRGHKVMLDRDLAELYGVETRALKQAVRRNKKRFPDDFMFEMNQEEFELWRSQNVASKEDKIGLRYAPFCFTEQGLAVLSCVRNSDQAIEMNIRVVRIFTQMRQMLLTHKDLLVKVNDLEVKLSNQGKSIKQIFAYLKELLKEQDYPREPIGFKTKREKRLGVAMLRVNYFGSVSFLVLLATLRSTLFFTAFAVHPFLVTAVPFFVFS